MPDNAAKGREGEDTAASFLAGNGYRVLARNVRVGAGEIDAVCLDGNTLVIVEVKRREGARFGGALGAVDARKRATLRKLAAEYAQVVAPSARIRFDVVTLDGSQLRLHRNAF
jgi:putative endonuclease